MSVLPRWHTYPAVRQLPKLPPAFYLPTVLRPVRDADYLLDDNYVFGQNMTEYNPAPSPSGHPLERARGGS